MKTLLFALSAVAALSASAATIGRQVVRQQWPWATDVTVEYELVDLTEPVDIQVKFYEKGAEVAVLAFHRHAVGDLHGVATSGIHSFRFDPQALFGAGRARLTSLRVELTPVAATPGCGDVLYKILDLEAHTVKDVTRGEILDGRYGTYETDFGAIGEGYATSLSDVLVWTGVTNDIAYKTTKMVLRKVPAAGRSFMMGKGDSGTADGAGVETSFSHDFWMGVFEVTQAQYGYFRQSTAWSAWETNVEFTAVRAVDNITFDQVRSYGEDGLGIWPNGTVKGAWRDRFFGKFRKAFAGALGEEEYLDLPTEAQWEFACRAGTTADLYSGRPASKAACAELGRFHEVNCTWGPVSSSERNCGIDQGSDAPGHYRPNAYGLYDMLGNVMEMCLDRKAALAGGCDPKGGGASVGVDLGARVIRGGTFEWGWEYGNCHYRYQSHNYPTEAGENKYVGFRVCLQTHDF